MKFLKENSSIIARLIITHIGMAAFGAVLFLATNLHGDGVMLVTSIFSAVFYAVIVYTTMWEYGSKDKPAIDAGRLALKPSKGFLTAILAESVSFLLIALFFVCSVGKETSALAADIYGISYIILTLLDSCFTGIVIFLRHKLESDAIIALVYLLGSLLICVMSMFGYVAGTKELRILPQKSHASKK